jgi:hypothetical protein
MSTWSRGEAMPAVDPDAPDVRVWKAAQASVTGAAHRKEGRPNQDACFVSAPGGPVALVAVADGHGSARYRRSDRGARLACDVAREVGEELLQRAEELGGHVDLAEEVEAEPWLARDVLRRWRERVEVELARAAEAEGAELSVDAFGTTLAFAVLAGDWSLFFQVGDGDLLVVDDGGELQRPLPADPLLLGTTTTSLVMKDAWRHARVALVPPGAYLPRLVVATTDGVSSSFEAQDGLAQFVRGIETLVATAERPGVEERLRGVLEHYTTDGSGDDVTVALAWRDPPRDPGAAAA